MTFTDEDYTPLFTVFNSDEDLVQSAIVDYKGKVIEHAVKTTDIVLENGQLHKLPDAKHIIFNGVANTYHGTSGHPVQLYDFYTMGLKLSMQVKGKVNL